MSLTLALVWVVCFAVCLCVFAFCRKRLADIEQQVAEEIDNNINIILKSEREAESQLLTRFSDFENTAEAINAYQKTESEIFHCPRAKPPWNWSSEELEFWRKCGIEKEKTHRGRPVILAILIVILAVNIAAATITVITLNVAPVTVSQSLPAGTSSFLPPAVSLPVQSWPDASSSLPENVSSVPPDNLSENKNDTNSTTDPNNKSKGECK